MSKRTLFCIVLIYLGFFIPKGLCEDKKKNVNFSFGKLQDLSIEIEPVPMSVGQGSTAKDPTVTEKKALPDSSWLRIDVPFQTTKKITQELKFKFFLEGYEVLEKEGGSGKEEEKFVILTGEAIYRDIPKGDKNYAGVFLPPASMVRFSGLKPDGQNEWKSKRLNLRVEAWECGVPAEDFLDLMCDKDKGPSGRGGKMDLDWYKSNDAQEIEGALLPVQDTPFWPKDYKHYPQPKKR